MRIKLFRYLDGEPDGNDGAQGAAPAQIENESDVDWVGIASDSDIEGEFEVPEEPGEVEASGEGNTAEEPQGQQPATQATEGEQPTPTSVAQNAPEGQQQQQQQQQNQQTTENPEETQSQQFDWDNWERQQTESLQSLYQLTEEESAAMLTEPETVLPKMAASLHVRIIRNVLSHLPQVLPPLIAQVSSVQQAEQQSRGTFFSVNDDLEDERYFPAIQQFGQLFRQMNPNASPEDAAFAVGNMVRQTFGMELRVKGQAQAPAQSQQAAPVARAKPFNPATGGGAGSGTPRPKNPFEALAEDLLHDM